MRLAPLSKPSYFLKNLKEKNFISILFNPIQPGIKCLGAN